MTKAREDKSDKSTRYNNMVKMRCKMNEYNTLKTQIYSKSVNE